MACGILIPFPRIKSMHSQWKHRVLTTGPPGTSFNSLKHVNSDHLGYAPLLKLILALITITKYLQHLDYYWLNCSLANLTHNSDYSRSPIRHIIFKISKDRNKEEILETGKEKLLVIYKGNPTRCDLTSHKKQWDSENRRMIYLKWICQLKKTLVNH